MFDIYIWLKIVELCTDRLTIGALLLSVKEIWLFYKNHCKSYSLLKESWFLPVVVNDNLRQIRRLNDRLNKNIFRVVEQEYVKPFGNKTGRFITRFCSHGKNGICTREILNSTYKLKSLSRFSHGKIVSKLSLSGVCSYRFWNYEKGVVEYSLWYDRSRNYIHKTGFLTISDEIRCGEWCTFYLDGSLKKKGRYSDRTKCSREKRVGTKHSGDVKSGKWLYRSINGEEEFVNFIN